MKHSVNGKSFDEIFGQRGTKVRMDKMLKGGIYLLDQEHNYTWNWLIYFDCIDDGEVFASTVELASDGDNHILPHTDRIGRCNSVKAVFEATPDQIDLLNSYKISRQMANLIAIAPKKGKIAEYLTNGKEYPITVCDEHGYYFRIIDDEGCEIFCTSSKCSAHLHGLNWTIKEATTDTEKNVHEVKERT